MLTSPLSLSRTMRIFSSDEYFFRVLRLISRTTFSDLVLGDITDSFRFFDFFHSLMREWKNCTHNYTKILTLNQPKPHIYKSTPNARDVLKSNTYFIGCAMNSPSGRRNQHTYLSLSCTSTFSTNTWIRCFFVHSRRFP